MKDNKTARLEMRIRPSDKAKIMKAAKENAIQDSRASLEEYCRKNREFSFCLWRFYMIYLLINKRYFCADTAAGMMPYGKCPFRED